MYKELANIFAPSGNEAVMGEFIRNRLSGTFDDIKTDNIGNVICTVGSGGLCIECGMDSPGVMITDIDGQKARFSGVGGINASYLIDKKIIFKDQTFGIVRYDGKSAPDSKISDLYLEGNFNSLKIGDFGVVDTAFCENDTHIFGNGIGNKVGIYAVIEAARKAKEIKNLTILFSAQKRIGAKGIQAFFAENSFASVVTVDGAEQSGNIKCGEGPSFVIADKSGVCGDPLPEKVKDIFDGDKEVKLSVTQQDMCIGKISTLGTGASCGAVAIPVEHKDKSFESVQKADIEDGIVLIRSLIENM